MTVSLDFVILSMMIWLAPGDIHRCVDASGAVQFRDQPCVQGQGTVFRYDPESGLENSGELHRWLQDMQGGNTQPGNQGRAARARPTLVLPVVDLAERPSGSMASPKRAWLCHISSATTAAAGSAKASAQRSSRRGSSRAAGR